MYEVAIYVLFLASCFFCTMFESDKKGKSWAGVFGSFSWIVLGLVFFVGSAAAGELGLLSVSLFFDGMGIVYIVRVMVMLLQVGKVDNRRLLDDEVEP